MNQTELPDTVAAWAERMADAWWHGVKAEATLCGPPGKRVVANVKEVATFALLFDRIEQVTTLDENGYQDSRHVSIPGHLTQLANWLASQGDPRAEQVRGMRVMRRDGPPGMVVFPHGPDPTLHPTYADAAREVIRRVVAILTPTSLPPSS